MGVVRLAAEPTAGPAETPADAEAAAAAGTTGAIIRTGSTSCRCQSSSQPASDDDGGGGASPR